MKQKKTRVIITFQNISNSLKQNFKKIKKRIVTNVVGTKMQSKTNPTLPDKNIKIKLEYKYR